MKKSFLIFIVVLSLSFGNIFAQQVFKTNKTTLWISVNGEKTEFIINPESGLQVLKLNCPLEKNDIVVSDGNSTMKFVLQQGQKVDFNILIKDTQKTLVQLIGEVPNVTFSPDYIKAFRGKNTVEIPEVSELINILLVLHKDAEKDHNMFDTQSDYYLRVKEYFAPYRQHEAVQLIEKHMGTPKFIAERNIYLFSMDAYKYYYALKLNSAGYVFDSNENIKNQGFIKEIGKEWKHSFDPMRDVSVFEDFAKKSNFRKFYRQNKFYYDALLNTFEKLSPIAKMQQWLETKFSSKYDSYRVFFSPLNKGAQAATHFEQHGFKQNFMFISKPIVYEEHSNELNELLTSWIVFTEIDHNYVNPLSDIFLKVINKSFSNRAKWAKGIGTEAYPDPYAVFNEYMTFALFTLYANDHYSADDIEKFLPMFEPMMENVRGFIRFKDFNRVILEKYRENPDIKMPYLYVSMLKWAENINDK